MSIINKNTTGWKGLPRPKRPPVMDCTLQLQNIVVPIDELRKPVHSANYDDQPAILVAKYGARGGLTIGLGNTLKSFVRRTEMLDGDREDYSEEWAITSIGRAADR
jgi:hypothetical protein